MGAVSPPDVAALVRLATRLGPLRHSALPPAPPSPPAGCDGVWLAGELDRWWARHGRPDPWVVVEVGARDGSRAAQVRAARPSCLPALRYLLVEDDPRRRAAQAAHLPLELPAVVLGPTGRPGGVLAAGGDDGDEDGDDGDEEEDLRPQPGRGPMFAALPDLPAGLGRGLVVTVGWLAGLPADVFRHDPGGWVELRLEAAGDRLDEVAVTAEPTDADLLARLVPEPDGDGGRVPLQRAARSWLQTAAAAVPRGTVVVADRIAPVTVRRPFGHPAVVFLDQLDGVAGPAEVDDVAGAEPGVATAAWDLTGRRGPR